jgi:hypothetical protein
MIRHLINKIKKKLFHNESRSGHWPTVRKEHIEANPYCSACGGKDELNVHHIQPFHLDPELELDPKNLITLCMGELNCHLTLGHGSSFRAYNPDVVADAKTIRESKDPKKSIKDMAPIIKAKRKF